MTLLGHYHPYPILYGDFPFSLCILGNRYIMNSNLFVNGLSLKIFFVDTCMAFEILYHKNAFRFVFYLKIMII